MNPESALPGGLRPTSDRQIPMAAFDYGTVAELFPTRGEVKQAPSRSGRRRRSPVGYGRFARGADAIRFAIEELPAELLPDACLEVDETIFDHEGILRLYESTDYPLERRLTTADRPKTVK